MNPTAQQISNRQLAVSGAAPTNPTAPSTTGIPTADYNDQAARQLNDYLQNGTVGSAEQQYEGGIMDRYSQAQKNTQSQYQDEYGALNAGYANQLDQLQRDNQQQQTGENESRTGFATNTAILRNLQETGENRIATLENARDDALLNNNAQMANSLNELIMNEQQLITSARQNYTSNLGTAATLQTPEEKNQLTQQANQQQSTMQLAQLAPDAGISSNDTYDQAIAKFRKSHYYLNNTAQAESTIAQLQAQANAANASAGASGAQANLSNTQAAQTRTLTGLVTGATGNDQADVSALLSGQMTPKQLQDKYANYPEGTGGAIAARVLSEAQSQGYDVNQGTLTGDAQSSQTSALNSGNPFYMLGGWASQAANTAARTLGQFAAPSSSSGNPGTMHVKLSNGLTGTVSIADFNPKTMTQIP